MKGIRDCLEMVRRFQERISRERRREGGRGERGGKREKRGKRKAGVGGRSPLVDFTLFPCCWPYMASYCPKIWISSCMRGLWES